MPSLYEAGWRLGSIFTARLPLDAVALDAHGIPARQQHEHNRWVVAAQECDLDLTNSTDPEPTIELRPVHAGDPPPDWGLRSSRFRLTESDYVAARDPRLFVSPALLTALLGSGTQAEALSDARSRAFALWLGRRYDRPAVPPHLVALAKRIATEVSRKAERVTGADVRDVLMQFDDTREPSASRWSPFSRTPTTRTASANGWPGSPRRSRRSSASPTNCSQRPRNASRFTSSRPRSPPTSPKSPGGPTPRSRPAPNETL